VPASALGPAERINHTRLHSALGDRSPILDELGYLALPDGTAELVFQVLCERHERSSLIVTTNLPFGEWTRGVHIRAPARRDAPPATDVDRRQRVGSCRSTWWSDDLDRGADGHQLRQSADLVVGHTDAAVGGTAGDELRLVGAVDADDSAPRPVSEP
jgi:hypothetical protein